MISPGSLGVYKNRPALVTAAGDKISISVIGGGEFRVREKDIEIIHPGPCKVADLEEALPVADIRGAWELLEGASLSLKELAELVYGRYSPAAAWAAYRLLLDGLYFSGSLTAIEGRPAADVEAEERKRREKQRETGEKDAFLERFKAGSLELPGDSRFLQDVEALALGRTDKSRTLRDLDRQETPQEAHRVLLEGGAWTVWVNPYPSRLGVSPPSPGLPLPPPPPEDRLDLTGLAAFAIDSPWSADPDDAISLEGDTLYVHVADPSASVLPDSPWEEVARGRGATCYLPEAVFPMLPPEALSFYGLGLSDLSPALSFIITLNKDSSIKEVNIAPSLVKVTRLTYEEADSRLDGGDLAGLFRLAEANLRRRLAAGAVSIEFPEVHIEVREEKVLIEPVKNWRSAGLVRECMLLAGEAAAQWAMQRRLPFPYVSQEAGDIPHDPLPGLAGSYQIRRCMRPRSLSARPGRHWGLGLEAYTQVTSPLRRYTDLLAHQQIRAFLAKGENSPSPLGEDEVLRRISEAEAASSAAVQAERASRAHWTAVYLMDKKGSSWEGVVLDRKGSRAVLMVPALGLETQVVLKDEVEPNGKAGLTLGTVRIPEAEAVFIA